MDPIKAGEDTDLPEPRRPLQRGAISIPPILFVLAVALILALRVGRLVWRFSVNVFFWDQWDFLRPFFEHDPSVGELFLLQHGPHREGIGLILDKYLYPLTAWNSRVDSFLIWGCVIAAMLLALLLKKRLFGRLDYWDALIPVMFLTLAQFATFTMTPNPAYSGFPLLLMMLYVLAQFIRNEWVKSGAILAINFLLIYTGFGVLMGVVTVGLFALMCYRRMRGFVSIPAVIPIAGLLIAGASLASFFYRYKFDPAVDCFAFPHYPLSDYPKFVAVMFSSFLDVHGPRSLVLILGASIVLFAVYVLALEFRRVTGKDCEMEIPLTVLVLLGYSMFFASNAAVGRACLPPDAAEASRYSTLLIPAFLAMYFYVRTISRRKIRIVALVLLAGVLVHAHIRLPRYTANLAAGKRVWADCYRRIENVETCDSQTHFKIHPNPELTRLKEKLDYLKIIRANLFSE